MKDAQRFRRPEQLKLFDPPKRLPAWRDLSLEARRRTVELLTRMLEDYIRVRAAGEGREGSDE